MGNQSNLNVCGDDFFRDLLFYNYHLHCFVVFDVKVGDFRPEFAGKLDFHINGFKKLCTMIFKNVLDETTAKLQPEFDKLFFDALRKQTHQGDLLLLVINGFYNPEVHTWDVGKKLSPYMFGPNNEGHSNVLHRQFITHYLKTNVSNELYNEYQQKHIFSPERSKYISRLTEQEGNSIQMEMLIYLKIWEADMFIKSLYQLTRLTLGQNYDWHFAISKSNRDKSKTGKREEIIRKKVRDLLAQNYPALYNSIKGAYKTQVRNSIAHSKYSFLGRYIHLNNKIDADPHSQIEVLVFDDWIQMFHDTLVIYNQITRLFILAQKIYDKAAKQNDLLQEIRITRRDPIEEVQYHLLKYRPQFKDWSWLANEQP